MEYYTFKHYNQVFHTNELSFIFSFWLIGLIALLLVLIFQNKLKTLWQTMQHTEFLRITAVSKIFDASNAWLWLHAVSLVTVSQVNAMYAFYPIILLLTVYAAQNVLKLKAEEKFSNGHLAFKILAVILLGIGGWLVR